MNDNSRTVVGLDVHKETIVGVSLLPNGIVDQWNSFMKRARVGLNSTGS